MPPITGTFLADYSAFVAQTQAAEKEVANLQAQADDTAASLTTITNPPTAGVNTLSESFRQFDGVLNAVGIHLGPAVKGLDDLFAASGKTATQLGILGTAGLAVGAAMGGWQIGRMIAEFTGADEAIANTTARLMGWGDLAGQTAAAQTDVLTLATQRAGRAISDMGEAIKVNQQWVDAHKKAATDAAKALDAWTKANQEVQIAAQDWRVVLDQVNGATVEAAKFALEHGVSEKTVATAYELTAPQIAAVVSALAAEKAALKESEEEHARITARLKEHWDGVLAIRDRVFGKDAIEQAQRWSDAVKVLGGTFDAFTNSQLLELKTAMDAAMDAMARSGRLTEQQSSEFAALAINAQAALDALTPVVAVTNDLAQAQYDQAVAADAAAQAQARATDEARKAKEQAAAAKESAGVFDPRMFPSAASLNAAAMRPGSFLGLSPGQMVASMPTSVGNLPWGVTLQSGAVQMNYPVMNDPQAMDQIGRVVGDAIMSRITRTGTRV